MRQKKTNKSKSNTRQYSKKRRLVLLLISTATAVLIVAGICGVFYYQKVQTQKRDFKEAESKMEQLRKAFVAELGDPVYQSKKEFCRYNNKPEFGYVNGKLDCSVVFNIWQPIKNGADAAAKVGILQSIAGTKNNITVKSRHGIADGFESGQNPSISSAETVFNVSAVSCSIDFRYASLETLDDISYPGSRAIGDNGGVLSVFMWCGSSPSRPFFPVTEE